MGFNVNCNVLLEKKIIFEVFMIHQSNAAYCEILFIGTVYNESSKNRTPKVAGRC